jgi:SAM-dependent methyltransferase
LSVFRWTAPLFELFGSNWSDQDFRILAAYLRPYVPEGGVFVDLGGGTGDLAAGIADVLAARAVIVDLTAQMLRRVDAHPQVSVCLASAEQLPFPDSFFDGLLCRDAFHHFRHQDIAAEEIARVVRPGGGVLVLEMEGNRLRDKPWVFLEKMLGEPAALHTASGLESFLAVHGITGKATIHHGTSYIFCGSVRRSVELTARRTSSSSDRERQVIDQANITTTHSHSD